jgi:hypothetical protein
MGSRVGRLFVDEGQDAVVASGAILSLPVGRLLGSWLKTCLGMEEIQLGVVPDKLRYRTSRIADRDLSGYRVNRALAFCPRSRRVECCLRTQSKAYCGGK